MPKMWVCEYCGQHKQPRTLEGFANMRHHFARCSAKQEAKA